MEGGDNAGEAKLNCYPQHLADVFSDLGEVVRLQGPALLTFLQEKAAEEEKRANRARLDKWAGTCRLTCQGWRAGSRPPALRSPRPSRTLLPTRTRRPKLRQPPWNGNTCGAVTGGTAWPFANC